MPASLTINGINSISTAVIPYKYDYLQYILKNSGFCKYISYRFVIDGVPKTGLLLSTAMKLLVKVNNCIYLLLDTTDGNILIEYNTLNDTYRHITSYTLPDNSTISGERIGSDAFSTYAVAVGDDLYIVGIDGRVYSIYQDTLYTHTAADFTLRTDNIINYSGSFYILSTDAKLYELDTLRINTFTETDIVSNCMTVYGDSLFVSIGSLSAFGHVYKTNGSTIIKTYTHGYKGTSKIHSIGDYLILTIKAGTVLYVYMYNDATDDFDIIETLQTGSNALNNVTQVISTERMKLLLIVGIGCISFGDNREYAVLNYNFPGVEGYSNMIMQAKQVGDDLYGLYFHYFVGNPMSLLHKLDGNIIPGGYGITTSGIYKRFTISDSTKFKLYLDKSTTEFDLYDYKIDKDTELTRNESTIVLNKYMQIIRDDQIVYSFIESFKNETATNVTIYGAGVVMEEDDGGFLISRDVFHTPVTVEPGKTFNITYNHITKIELENI